jgi:hypothetical protein
MTYRADVDALKTRCETLEHELSDLRARAREIDSVRRAETEKERELAAARSTLDAMQGKRALPMLDTLRVASPCKASWEDMVGDARVRFCGQCAKNVYNLSAMARDEAEALLVAKAGNVCVRFYQRADGTVMTTDCPVGVRKKRVRRAAVAVAAGGVMAASTLMLSARQGTPQPVMGGLPSMTVMGEPAVASPAVQGSAAPLDLSPPPRVIMGRKAPSHSR